MNREFSRKRPISENSGALVFRSAQPQPQAVSFLFQTGEPPTKALNAAVIRADAPPHPECWQRAGAELRGRYGLIQNQWRRKIILIVNLDGVTRRSGDVAPIKCDVCSRREARVGRRTDERRCSKARCGEAGVV